MTCITFLFLFAALALSGCNAPGGTGRAGEGDPATGPDGGPSAGGNGHGTGIIPDTALWAGLVPGDSLEPLLAALAAQEAHEAEILADSQVTGMAAGLRSSGEGGVWIFLSAAAAAARMPDSLDGVAVVTEVPGAFLPAAGKAGRAPGGPAPGAEAPVSTEAIAKTVRREAVGPRDRQTPPIRLGSSGGWAGDGNAEECCGGTLGALVTDGRRRFILSNFHVFQGDQVPGSNLKTARAGDFIVQSGLLDLGCNPGSAQNVARITGAPSLPGSNVDAALAEVLPGMVDESGHILDIGPLSRLTLNARLGLKVKKSGRTTGLTRSRVVLCNATVKVPYGSECGGGTAFTQRFTGQIMVANGGASFLDHGDSGSLLVEDVDGYPRAVGLLFCSNRTYAVANPIREVLARYKVAMVGR